MVSSKALTDWAELRRDFRAVAINNKNKRANIVVLDMPLLDPRNSRDLTGTLIADIVLQLLSYVAQTEREFIKQRQSEGIAAAKKFGRPKKTIPTNFNEIHRLCIEHRISTREASRRLKVSYKTFIKWSNEFYNI